MDLYDTMRQVVLKGSDLTLYKAINNEVLKDLVEIASKSGSTISISIVGVNRDLLLELSAKYGDKISFFFGHGE